LINLNSASAFLCAYSTAKKVSVLYEVARKWDFGPDDPTSWETINLSGVCNQRGQA
jgi:hypothetical protein